MPVFIRVSAADRARLDEAFALYGRQAAFATALTLNDIARGVRDAIRAELPNVLTIRTPVSRKFLDQSVQAPREFAATKDRLAAGVVVDRLQAGLLPTLGTGGTNRTGPWGPPFVPTDVLRPSKEVAIARDMYPRALGVLGMRAISGGVLFSRIATRAKRGRVRKGQRIGAFQGETGKWHVLGQARTFALDPRFHRVASNQAGVYQRTGPGAHDLRMLWYYPKQVPIPARVPYQRLADETTTATFPTLFELNLARALATAR